MITYIKDGIIYQRIGECKICGKCCRGIVYIRNYKSSQVESVGKINEVCSFLKENRCEKHDEKNQLCEKYPLMKEETDLFPNCGYSWKEIGKTKRKNSRIILKKTLNLCKYYKIGEKNAK